MTWKPWPWAVKLPLPQDPPPVQAPPKSSRYAIWPWVAKTPPVVPPGQLHKDDERPNDI